MNKTSDAMRLDRVQCMVRTHEVVVDPQRSSVRQDYAACVPYTVPHRRQRLSCFPPEGIHCTLVTASHSWNVPGHRLPVHLQGACLVAGQNQLMLLAARPSIPQCT